MKLKSFVTGSILCGLSFTVTAALAGTTKEKATPSSHKSSQSVAKSAIKAVHPSATHVNAAPKAAAKNVFKAAAKETKPEKNKPVFKSAIKSNLPARDRAQPKATVKEAKKDQVTSENAAVINNPFAKSSADVNVKVADRKPPSQIRIPFARPKETVTQVMAGDIASNELYIFSEDQEIPKTLVEIYPGATMATIGGDEKIAVKKVNEFKETLEKVVQAKLIAAQLAKQDNAFLKSFSEDQNLALNTEQYKQRFEIKVQSGLDPDLQAVQAPNEIKTAAVDKPISAKNEVVVEIAVQKSEQGLFADKLKHQHFTLPSTVSIDAMLADLSQNDKWAVKYNAPAAPVAAVKTATMLALNVGKDDREVLTNQEIVSKTLSDFSRQYCELSINLYLAFHKPPAQALFSPRSIQQAFNAMGPAIINEKPASLNARLQNNPFVSSVHASLSETLQTLAENNKLFAVPVMERQINTALIHKKLDAMRAGINKTQTDQYALTVHAPLGESLKVVAENNQALAVVHVTEVLHDKAQVATREPIADPAVVEKAFSSKVLAMNNHAAATKTNIREAIKVRNRPEMTKPEAPFVPRESSLDDLPKPKKEAKAGHTPSADSQRLSKEVLAARERALQTVEKQLEEVPDPVVIKSQAYRDDNAPQVEKKQPQAYAEEGKLLPEVKRPTRDMEEDVVEPKRQMQAEAYPGFAEEGDAFSMDDEESRPTGHSKVASAKGKTMDENPKDSSWEDFGDVDGPSNFAAFDDGTVSDEEAFDKSLAMRESSEFSRLMEE